jgi:uncharacterized membrane protein YdjX (TVP38/TMEM64 family)
MTGRRWRLLPWLVVGAAVLAAVVSVGLGDFDADTLAARLRAQGPLGPALLLVLLVLQCVIAPLPSEPLMMGAGFVYGTVPGAAIGWLGVVLGAAVCFALARTLGRPFAERFVRGQQLAAVDTYVDGRGRGRTFLAVLAVRLFAFMSFDVVSYACGLIRFPFHWFLLATALGAVPKVWAFTYLGVSAAARPAWLDGVLLVGTFGVLAVAPWVVRWVRGTVVVAAPVAAGERGPEGEDAVPSPRRR